MNPSSLSVLVQTVARRLGFHLVGVAPAGPSPDFARYARWLAAGYHGDMSYLARRAADRADPRSLMPEARSVIVLGASYSGFDLPAAIRDDPSRGLIASYAWGNEYHDVLKELLTQLDAAIRSATGRDTPGRAYVDTGPILERSWAVRAGLGFTGKNTCLIVPGEGSWLFLGVLLVPEVLAEVPPASQQNHPTLRRPSPQVAKATALAAQRANKDVQQRYMGCGACVRCLNICPTAAFPQPHTLDARRCISYLTIELRGPIPLDLRPQMGNWIFGCDLCQTVCPWNRRFAGPAGLAPLQPRPAMVAPSLLDLLVLDEEGFRRRFRRSPVRRAKRRGLLRNVCVALGNWGSPQAVPGLIDALQDGEVLVRGAAAWALGRVGTPKARLALEQRLAREADDYAQHEITAALSWATR